MSSGHLGFLDLLRFSTGSLRRHGLRTGLSLLGVTIGVMAVVILTALGDGARNYVINQFASLGTNLLIVLPGKTETTGSFGVGGVPNDLTLSDAQALERGLLEIRRVAPVTIGTEIVSAGERSRQIAVLGTIRAYTEIRDLTMARGEFLPAGEMFRGSPVVVLGSKAARELFPGVDPIGSTIRIGAWRMRVIGILAPQGVKLGVDFDDIAVIPVQTGMQMLNRTSLFRIICQVSGQADLETTKQKVLELLADRHDEEDVTVLTQDAVVSTFASILDTLTLTVAAIAAISLSVAGIGIMNVMLVSVSERTREIGLLKAIGASNRQILLAFLTEAVFISGLGGLLGLGLGWASITLLIEVFPQLPARAPLWAVVTSLALSIAVGAVFGLLPARRATRLEPVAALSGR